MLKGTGIPPLGTSPSPSPPSFSARRCCSPGINRFPERALIYLIMSAFIHYLENLIDSGGKPGASWPETKIVIRNCVAAVLRHPDHSLRPHRHVLHRASIRPCD